MIPGVVASSCVACLYSHSIGWTSDSPCPTEGTFPGFLHLGPENSTNNLLLGGSGTLVKNVKKLVWNGIQKSDFQREGEMGEKRPGGILVPCHICLWGATTPLHFSPLHEHFDKFPLLVNLVQIGFLSPATQRNWLMKRAAKAIFQSHLVFNNSDWGQVFPFREISFSERA